MELHLENNTTMHATVTPTTLQFQQELERNKLLPYADELEDEANTLLSEIKGNLGRAILLRELKPGCVFWTNKLQKYIELYGIRFTKEDHILFIKLMYDLITIPKLDPLLIIQFSNVLKVLLKKQELISREDLELPWRPLYELTHQLKSTTKANIGLCRYPAILQNTLNLLVHKVKIYFPVSATQEILDELRPGLCPLYKEKMEETLRELEWYLPLHLPPKHHPFGYELWFDELMRLWEVCHNAPTWETNMMLLMARLASTNIGYINWEPHVPLMFTRFVRCLNLPVTYKQQHVNKCHKIETSAIAIWIVSTLGNGSSVQTYLEKFLKSIETYFHPANTGWWLEKLQELFAALSRQFLKRLRTERYGKKTWETPIPDTHKLTDNDIDAFVKCMMPIAMTVTFNKARDLTSAYYGLMHLATIRPSLVIPDVLERMYSTLDSVTEPHKLTATMLCMVSVARPMVQGPRNVNKGYTYTEGPMHVIPILFSSLPGIDPNDLLKSHATLRLIHAYVRLVPIVDSSRIQGEMDEQERMICEMTSRFEDFVLQFLDRVFLFIDSSSLEFVRLESVHGVGKSMAETHLEAVLASAFITVLRQTSNSIFQSALHKLKGFIADRIFETKVAGQLTALVCRIFAYVNGKDTLHVLVPMLCNIILSIIGDNEDIMKEEHLDNQLLYAMLLLSSIVATQGNLLLPHLNELSKVLDHVLRLQSREGNTIATLMLRNVFCSLSSLTFSHFKIHGRDYNESDYPYFRDWGKLIDIDSLTIQWYVPGDEEYTATQELFSKYISPEVEKLQRYCEDWNTLTRAELLSCLTTVGSILVGCEHVLPNWEAPLLDISKSAVCQTPFFPTVGIKKHIVMPDGSNIKHFFTELLTKVQAAVLKYAEDDTKSISMLIKIWNVLLLGRIRQRDLHEVKQRNYNQMKELLGDRLIGTNRYNGLFLFLDWASYQHETRTFTQIVCLMETHKTIILNLFELATSRYADVRSEAQGCLSSTLEYFHDSYMIIMPHILEILKKDINEYHDAHKGVLYILCGPRRCPLIIQYNWKLLKSLWPALVLSNPSEKLSVIRLKTMLLDIVQRQFPTIPISLEVPESYVKTAYEFWNSSPGLTLPQPSQDEIKKGLEILQNASKENVEDYNSLMDELLNALLKENLHWRHKSMAMSFIRLLVHVEQIYSPKIIRYFLNALIHDSLKDRNTALVVALCILKQQKRKHTKVQVDVSTLAKIPSEQIHSSKCEPGIRLDNMWLQYDFETRPLTAEQWDEPRFIHKTHIGYYTWPKKLEVYAPSSQQPILDPKLRELTCYEKEVDNFFSDPGNIEKLIKFFSLEEKKGQDKFNRYKYLFFKNLFRNHGIAYLPLFTPHLYKLVSDKQESSQRCATEIVAGIIQGAKHWPFQMTCEMWETILPIIRTALSNPTVETVNDWSACFYAAVHCRDPNRYHWLLECLMEEPPLGESETSFVKSARLCILQNALLSQSWRVMQLLQRVLTQVEDRLLMNPLQSVRQRLGSILVTVFNADLRFPNTYTDQLTPRAQNFINKMIPRLVKLAEDITAKDTKDEQCSLLDIRNMKLSQLETNSSSNETEQEIAILLLETVCKWITESISHSQHGTLPGFYEIFPIICQMENYDTNQELSKACVLTLAKLAQAFTLPCDMPKVLDAVSKASVSPSWWTRATCLNFLQVLIFHNMGVVLSDVSWVLCIQNIVLNLLEDTRLEVREKAGQVLGGLLHCMFIPEQEALLERFKKKAATKLHSKVHLRSTQGEQTNGTNIEALRTRHAGVLGLCAFISAHPYDIPKYVPVIFEHLSTHLNDPQPIPTTIRRTLADFKRTHYDGWTGVNGHAEQFTEVQLAILQDLTIPPVHYA